MIRRLAPVWALVLLTMAGPGVRAQNPFPRDLIPSRTSLARLGLDRQWTAVVPLNETERVRRISRSADLFFGNNLALTAVSLGSMEACRFSGEVCSSGVSRRFSFRLE